MNDRLTFGRDLSFIGEMVIVSVPLLYASPPQLFTTISTKLLTAIVIISLTFSIIFSYHLLRKVGQSTYSPKLHSRIYIGISTILLFLFSLLVVYIGYLLVVYPQTELLVPARRDISIGLFVTSLYLIALSGINIATVWSRERKKQKERLVAKFTQSASDLQSANLENAEELASEVLSSGQSLEEGLKKEPMEDATELYEQLQEWLDDFENQNSLSDKKRMVGWTVGPEENRDEPWEAYYSKFVCLQKRLSRLDPSTSIAITDGS